MESGLLDLESLNSCERRLCSKKTSKSQAGDAVSRRFLSIIRLNALPLSSSPNLTNPETRKEWSRARDTLTPPARLAREGGTGFA